MSRNFYRALIDLMPAPALLVGQVAAVSNGVASIQLPSGQIVQARGSATVGDRVFFRDGVIEGNAPALPTVSIEV